MMSDKVRRTLDALIHDRGEDYASLSRLLGRNPTYVQQFIKRGVPRRLNEQDRRILAEHFGVPELALGGPVRDGTAAASTTSNENDPSEFADNDFIFVPYLEIKPSTAGGYLTDLTTSQGAVAFRRDWIRNVASGLPRDLAVLQVEGDSMCPSLSHGDHILVDTAQGRNIRDGVYVIRVDGALLVKRVSVNPSTRQLTIRSDNPAYASWPDCDPSRIDVIGRVVWVGRRL